MIKKIKKAFFLMSFIIFIFLVSKYYFSEKNIIITNKSRSSYSATLNINNENNIPVLKNDTSNIIIYKNDLEEFKKKRKKRIWEKLISDQNE